MHTLGRFVAREALKKFYDGSFIERGIPVPGTNYIHIRGNHTDSYRISTIKECWQQSWSVTLLGAMTLGFLKLQSRNVDGSSWWTDNFVEEILLSVWSQDMIKALNRYYNKGDHSTYRWSEVSKLPTKTIKLLECLADHGDITISDIDKLIG